MKLVVFASQIKVDVFETRTFVSFRAGRIHFQSAIAFLFLQENGKTHAELS
jgi:hypothetical protein